MRSANDNDKATNNAHCAWMGYSEGLIFPETIS